MDEISSKLKVQSSKASNVKVVIVISLYTAKQYLPDLFGSLFRCYVLRHAQDGSDWVKVVAIDDRSPDETFEIVKKEYPWVDVIQSETNLGFAKANNVATEYAVQKYDPEYLFYLNQDTQVEEEFLEKLLSVVDTDEGIGIVQPLLMIYPFDKGVINCAGCRLHYLGYGYTIDEGKKHRVQGTGYRVQEIPYASGAAFLIRSSIVKRFPPLKVRGGEGGVMKRPDSVAPTNPPLEDLSPPYLKGEIKDERTYSIFDPYYVAYHEDADLSLRVKQLEYRVVLCPESQVAHKYTTPDQVKDKKQANHNAYYWIERNRFVLFAKFWSTRMLVLFFPAFVINEIGVMAFSMFRGFWKERLRMYGWLFSHWNELREIRKRTQRTLTWERDLMRMLSSDIWHGNADSVVLGIANVFWRWYFVIVKNIIL